MLQITQSYYNEVAQQSQEDSGYLYVDRGTFPGGALYQPTTCI